MKLLLIGHDCRYAVEQLQLSLFPREKTELTAHRPDGSENCAVSRLSQGSQWLTATTTIQYNGKTARASRRLRVSVQTERLRRRILQQSYYLAARQLLDDAPPWGALAGVRPTKLTTGWLLRGDSPAQAERRLRREFYVTPARAALCVQASRQAVQAAQLLRPNDLSVYIGIPFCPTRCVYCSFISQSAAQSTALIAPYLEALEREILQTGELLAHSPCRVRTIYIGGGTPTTLCAAQLAHLMDTVASAFDLSQTVEYTVEAGRPDTVDAEKLAVLRAHGADRVSINPQTMHDEILQAIGRRHTVRQTLAAFAQARQAGFSQINMDLIAGLCGQTPALFRRSIEQVIALAPENVTVHTLALKKGAALFASDAPLPSGGDVAQMLSFASDALTAAGYRPYYLYRQKYMSGSFENIGWCREETACLYNIYMMEELHPVLSFGAGAVSKATHGAGMLTRLHNPKYPAEYIARPDEALAQKRRFFDVLRERWEGKTWNI